MQKNIRNRRNDTLKKKISFFFKAACVIVLLIIGIKYLYDRESPPEPQTKDYEAGDGDASFAKDNDTDKRKDNSDIRKNEPAKVTSVQNDTKKETVPDDDSGDVQDDPKDDRGSSTAESRLYDENGRLNINVAGKTELMKLNGIGEKRAQDIIDYREKNGGFKSIEEIMKVKGIKQGIFSKLKDQIYTG